MVFVQFPVEHIDRVRRLRTQPPHMLQSIDGQMKPAHLVEHDHIEWSGGRAHIIKSAHVKTRLIRAPMHHAVNQPTIAVECEDHIHIRRKHRVERNIVHAVGMIVRAHQGS